jgi:hypothetical protein
VKRQTAVVPYKRNPSTQVPLKIRVSVLHLLFRNKTSISIENGLPMLAGLKELYLVRIAIFLFPFYLAVDVGVFCLEGTVLAGIIVVVFMAGYHCCCEQKDQ